MKAILMSPATTVRSKQAESRRVDVRVPAAMAPVTSLIFCHMTLTALRCHKLLSQQLQAMIADDSLRTASRKFRVFKGMNGFRSCYGF